MRKLFLPTLILGLGLGAQAQAQNVHIGPPSGFISRAVVVPAGSDTIYVSGITPQPLNAGAPAGAPLEYGDTKAQTASILKQIDEILQGAGFTLGDVVMMRVFLVGDPAKGGKMDFAGMMEAYKALFGTAAQPNKPARITMQISALAAPQFLAEIEVQAAKKK